LWSASGSQSVLEARRMIVYASVALALVVLARGSATRALVLATHAAIALVVVYALARYLLGSRPFDVFEGTLLSRPIGYANGLGALAAIGTVLGVGLAARGESRLLRSAASASVPLPPLPLS